MYNIKFKVKGAPYEIRAKYGLRKQALKKSIILMDRYDPNMFQCIGIRPRKNKLYR